MANHFCSVRQQSATGPLSVITAANHATQSADAGAFIVTPSGSESSRVKSSRASRVAARKDKPSQARACQVKASDQRSVYYSLDFSWEQPVHLHMLVRFILRLDRRCMRNQHVGEPRRTFPLGVEQLAMHFLKGSVQGVQIAWKPRADVGQLLDILDMHAM